MKRDRPPRLASLLIERLGPQDASIVGDLAEEWQAGRSALWYWRQIIGALAYHAVADVQAHWLIVLRGILIGVSLLLALGWMTAVLDVQTRWWLLRYPSGVILFHQYQLGFLIHIVNWFAATVLAGSILTRLHRGHIAATVVGVLVVIAVFELSNGRLYFLIRNSFTHERFVPYLALHVLQIAVGMLGVLLGALLPRPLRQQVTETT